VAVPSGGAHFGGHQGQLPISRAQFRAYRIRRPFRMPATATVANILTCYYGYYDRTTTGTYPDTWSSRATIPGIRIYGDVTPNFRWPRRLPLRRGELHQAVLSHCGGHGADTIKVTANRPDLVDDTLMTSRARSGSHTPPLTPGEARYATLFGLAGPRTAMRWCGRKKHPVTAGQNCRVRVRTLPPRTAE